jgi:hypothetical protein
VSDYNLQPYSEDALPEVISPEGASIANTYLANACSLTETSHAMDLPTHEIAATLQQPLVKTYVNSILRETGYRHMVKIAEKLDALVDLKWEELEEAEIGSNKDIADLLQLAHKMRMDMYQLLQADIDNGPSAVRQTQVNVKIKNILHYVLKKIKRQPF